MDEVRTCRDCKTELPIGSFYKNKKGRGGHLSVCKSCTAVRYGAGVRERSAKFRAYVQAIKVERGCADCGYNAHPAALDFDHLPGHLKAGKLASMACGSSMKTIHAEIDKCDVVCANCHRIRTAERRRSAGDVQNESLA